MTLRVRWGGASSAHGRRLIPPLLAGLLLSACHPTPVPVVVPLLPSGVRFAQLRHTIDGLISAPALDRGTWGIAVRSMDRNETLYSLNAGKLMMPASTLKVVTLAVAADQLGWDFTYRTSLLGIGAIDGGVLEGDLLVVGTGDPTIDDWDGAASSRFAEWAALLRQSGVRTISGRIIGDDNVFDDDGIGMGWAWDDLGASYATGVGALQFNQNTAQIIVAGAAVAGQPPRVDVRPPAAALSVHNHATTEAGAPTLSVRPAPRAPALELTGTVPLATSPVVRNVSVPNPTIYFVNALKDALIENGIDVQGPAEDIDDLSAPLDRSCAAALTEWQSGALSGIGSTMMKMSQNLFAETLLKTLGVHAAGTGSAATGRAAIGDVLARWGVLASDILMVDGSGLSRYNLVTPDALVAVLAHVYRDERLRGRFLEALPVAGVDGTLSDRMKGTAASGNARAKTGSFSNARSLAGYVGTADGEMVAFTIFANNYGLAPAMIDRVADEIVVALARFSRLTGPTK